MEKMKRIIFLNIGWMRNYKGITDTDKIYGGGKYVDDNEYGSEIFNFLPFKGNMYGYARCSGGINIERIGADPGSNSVKDVLVVWVANSPSIGSCIVGWYKNAVLFREHQKAPKYSNRYYNGGYLGYIAKAKEKDCFLIPVSKRSLKVPRGKNGIGQRNIWYADNPKNKPFISKVIDLVYKNKYPSTRVKMKKKSSRWQVDFEKRKRVEISAIKSIWDYYERQGYSVYSVEKENKGWDLEAVKGKDALRLEVKGLSHNDISIDMSPNEYKKMNSHRNSYRICVVSNALRKKPTISIFIYSPVIKGWEDDIGKILNISEVVSARLTV